MCYVVTLLRPSLSTALELYPKSSSSVCRSSSAGRSVRLLQTVDNSCTTGPVADAGCSGIAAWCPNGWVPHQQTSLGALCDCWPGPALHVERTPLPMQSHVQLRSVQRQHPQPRGTHPSVSRARGGLGRSAGGSAGGDRHLGVPGVLQRHQPRLWHSPGKLHFPVSPNLFGPERWRHVRLGLRHQHAWAGE